jgi:glycosyltransferase involved in cell wall biosynthesis
VAARASCLLEVVGDAAGLVGPLNAESIADGIVKVLTVPNRRSKLVRLGTNRVSSFSWTTTARKNLDVLETVATRGNAKC